MHHNNSLIQWHHHCSAPDLPPAQQLEITEIITVADNFTKISPATIVLIGVDAGLFQKLLVLVQLLLHQGTKMRSESVTVVK